MAVALGTAPVAVGPAVPACNCADCRWPTPYNAATRDNHALCHAEFAAFLGEQPVSVPKPSMRSRLLWIGQEWTA